MPHTLQWIFIASAAGLIILALALFAWALFTRGNPARARAIREADAFALRSHEWRQLKARLDKGEIGTDAFAREERQLAAALLDDLSVPEEAASKTGSDIAPVLRWGTIVALIVAIPAGSAGLYLRYGDYSALDDRAIAQIDAVRTEEQRAQEMTQTMASLEEAVKKNPDQLEAWEILADQYTTYEEFHKAVTAWRNVSRLKPDDVTAAVNFLDALVAIGDVDTQEVQDLVKRILRLDPHEPKTLVLAGLLNYQKGSYSDAVLYWNRLRQNIPEGDEMRQVLDENIARAMKEGNLKNLPLDTAPPPAPVMMPKGMPGGMGGMGGMQGGAMPPAGGMPGSMGGAQRLPPMGSGGLPSAMPLTPQK